ncbi:MAG: M20/M25/M40 family metallo-hydrolase [Saprospiraceae bacterium]
MTTRTKAGIIAFLACILFTILTLKLFSPPKALPATADTTEFSAERAMQQLKVIAEAPHSLGTLQNDKVISYLVQELNQLGVEVSIQDTLVSRTRKGNPRTRVSRVKNVIGRLKGTNNTQAVLLMAHHDSQPNTPGAADDGSGVVSILETIRAIKASGPLKNDVIVLITDAEEIGLMGAKAFVDYHPFLQDVGILVNVEARGNFGVSMSFEMNPENGWVVREFAKAAPYPFANSMAYEIYKVMPNDTDFSMFRETPVAGVNSATVEGLVHYHSMTDTPENISLDLLQHHGANMLGMARHFGNLAIQDTKAPDAIFFNPIGSNLVIYPASYDLPFMLLTVFLFILTVIIGIKKQQVNLQELFNGIGYFLIILAVAGIGSYVLQQVILILNPHYTLFYGNSFYNIGYYFFAFLGFAGLFYTIIYGFQPKVKSLSLSLGGLLMLVMAMFGLTLSLPTGTYVLYYPIGIYLAVQLLLLFLNITADTKPVAFAAGQFLAVVPAIGLWSQTIYLLFHTFALTEAVIAPVLLFCFLGILLVPILRMISL